MTSLLTILGALMYFIVPQVLGLTELKNKSDKEVRDHIKEFTRNLRVSLIVFANDKIDFRVN